MNWGSCEGERWRSMADGVDLQISKSSSWWSAGDRGNRDDCTNVDNIPQAVFCTSLHPGPVQSPDLMSII